MRNRSADIALLGVLTLTILPGPIRGQDSPPDTEKRISQLEQRVDKLEKLLSLRSDASPVTVTKAKSKFDVTQEKLQHTKQLVEKGYVSEKQLDADKLAVAKALKELQLAKSVLKSKQTALERDVLRAEKNLAVAKAHLQHSERLRAKGYVSELQVKGAKLEAKEARKHLEQANSRLKKHQQSLKNADSSKTKTESDAP